MNQSDEVKWPPLDPFPLSGFQVRVAADASSQADDVEARLQPFENLNAGGGASCQSFVND